MSNRIYLYMTAEPAADGSAESVAVELAESSYAIPPLWQLLLADGQATEAITDQRVFGDAGTDNIGVRASEGLLRLRQLRDLMTTHPFQSEFTDAWPHFDAWLQVLAQQAAQIEQSGRTAWISASLDEAYWLEDDMTPEEFIQVCLEEFHEAGQTLERACRNHSYADLDLFLWPEYHVARWDWQGWFRSAGLNRQVTSSNEKSESSIARSSDEGVAILESEWDAVVPCIANPELYWVERDGLHGLMRIEQGVAHELVPPILTSRGYFNEGYVAVHVASTGHCGVLALDGSIHHEPSSASTPQ